MRARTEALAARLPPKGWTDLFRQLARVGGAYVLYRIARGFVKGRAAQAFDNARELVGIERTLGLFVEPAVHAWAGSTTRVIDFSSWMYFNSHFTVTALTLAWIYVYRNSAFYFVRDMVLTRPHVWAFRIAPHGAPA